MVILNIKSVSQVPIVYDPPLTPVHILQIQSVQPYVQPISEFKSNQPRKRRNNAAPPAMPCDQCHKCML